MIEAFQAQVAGTSEADAQAALKVAQESLQLGLPPIQACAAASAKLFPDLMQWELKKRNALMVAVFNGLMHADAADQLGSDGLWAITFSGQSRARYH